MTGLSAKWIRDRSIFSSEFPKQYIQQFVSLFPCLVRVANLKLFWQFCKSKQKQFHVHYLYKTRKLSNFDLIEETMELSCILLAVTPKPCCFCVKGGRGAREKYYRRLFQADTNRRTAACPTTPGHFYHYNRAVGRSEKRRERGGGSYTKSFDGTGFASKLTKNCGGGAQLPPCPLIPTALIIYQLGNPSTP